MAKYFEVAADIAHECIEGEVIILSFASGSYFSLDGTGALIWSRIVTGANHSEICAQLAELYPAQADTTQQTVDTFLADLVSEQLLTEKSEKPTGQVNSGEPVPAPPEFTTPIVNKHADMQDLILLDPIHDVDEQTGWPTPLDRKTAP